LSFDLVYGIIIIIIVVLVLVIMLNCGLCRDSNPVLQQRCLKDFQNISPDVNFSLI